MPFIAATVVFVVALPIGLRFKRYLLLEKRQYFLFMVINAVCIR